MSYSATNDGPDAETIDYKPEGKGSFASSGTMEGDHPWVTWVTSESNIPSSIPSNIPSNIPINIPRKAARLMQCLQMRSEGQTAPVGRADSQDFVGEILHARARYMLGLSECTSFSSFTANITPNAPKVNQDDVDIDSLLDLYNLANDNSTYYCDSPIEMIDSTLLFGESDPATWKL